MSRKDYVSAAQIIRAERERYANSPDALEATERVAHGLASMFAADNARFDRARFLSACGIDAR